MLADVIRQGFSNERAIALTRYRVNNTSLPRIPMVWCTCPIRCQGGREVAARTRSGHQRELRDKEDLRLLQQYGPERAAPPSDVTRRRRRANDDDPQGTHSKKVRGSGEQGEVSSVRVSVNLSQLKLMSR
jgi:hypothetical protein